MKRHYTIQDTMYIVFRDVEDGLAVRRDSAVLAGFAIADTSRNFVKAQAAIINESTVAVFAENVHNPCAVRYAWAKDPVCNLINSAGLPAGPFRTDCWPSQVTYSIPDNTAAPNGDNSLLCIHVNGDKLADFSNDTKAYTLIMDETFGVPYVTAIARHPMSKMTIVQAKSISALEEADRTAVITVTAENGSQSEFRIIFETLPKPDAIDGVFEGNAAEKMIRNGALIIRKSDRMYTAVGAEL